MNKYLHEDLLDKINFFFAKDNDTTANGLSVLEALRAIKNMLECNNPHRKKGCPACKLKTILRMMEEL